MKSSSTSRHRRGFTLVETVFAIGVLAVLLTAFIIVFTPAAEGIKKSINIQLADRLASTVEQELVTLRAGQKPAGLTTGFDKSFDWIKGSNSAGTALMLYQYRGKTANPRTDDGTPTPEPSLDGKQAGKDYVLVPMMRRLDDTAKFNEDLKAVEGPVYLVKCTQLVFGNLPSPATGTGLIQGTPGKIFDPKGGTTDLNAAAYPEAVIAFSADFYMVSAKTAAYFTSTAFTSKFPNLKNPVFTRNLAVRR